MLKFSSSEIANWDRTVEVSNYLPNDPEFDFEAAGASRLQWNDGKSKLQFLKDIGKIIR